MKVLYIGEDETGRRLMRQVLETRAIECDTASDGAAGLRQAATGTYDVIAIDLHLPDMEGMALMRQLRARGDGRPIIAITAGSGSPEEWDLVHAVGANAYLSKRGEWNDLLVALHSVTELKVLLIEDHDESADMIRKSLDWPFEVTWVKTGLKGLDALRAEAGRFAAIIVDLHLPAGLDGLELLRFFQASLPAELAQTAMVIYSGEPESVVRGRGMSYDGYLQKPIDPFVLNAQMKAWIQQARRRG